LFEEERKARLERFLAKASGAVRVKVAALELLAGGAIQENWGFSAEFAGGPFDGRQRLVLRTDAPTGIATSLGRVEESAVLRAAFAAGVTMPEPLWVCADLDVIGKPFFVMRRVAGTAQGRRITTDAALDPLLPEIAARLGRELARLQTIRPPRLDLAFLPSVDAAAYIAGFRAYLDEHPNARPVLEWGIRWLETHIPAPLAPVLCHRDFRTGNYVLDGPELTGILDWEFAGWGDPDEDIGWFCCKGWRFARLDREAGGIADRAPFYAAYESAAGRPIDPDRVRFWEVLANVRWALIALQQSDRYLLGGARDLSTAIIGRRATECELELLMLLDPEGPQASGRPAGETPAVHSAMRDAPSGIGLAGLGREWLLNELLPLLPSELHRNLRLVATAIAIAEREAAAGDAPVREIEDRLVEFYGPLASRPLLQTPECGQDARGPIGTLLRRLAADLRVGAFEQCASRGNAARAILWRLTMLKLREGNPGFLAANGFGE
jgi:aminoglycoside phosphotransferase (APT) family kinase protein